MKRSLQRTLIVGALIGLVPAAGALAAMVMPDFSTVPTDWTTDRYDPYSFSNVGVYQGKSDVLGIAINRAQGASARPSGYGDMFYNTQGRQHALSGAGVGSVLGASLFIESAWSQAASGNVRSDMWGVVSDTPYVDTNSITQYPVIGFTNFEGAARYRIFDGDLNGGSGAWVDLTNTVQFGTWVDFEIELTATSIIYSVDGNVVYTDTTTGGGTQFSATIMQAYNFFDTSIANAMPANYVAHWANLDADGTVPEPGTLVLFALALLGASSVRRRSRE